MDDVLYCAIEMESRRCASVFLRSRTTVEGIQLYLCCYKTWMWDGMGKDSGEWCNTRNC